MTTKKNDIFLENQRKAKEREQLKNINEYLKIDYNTLITKGDNKFSLEFEIQQDRFVLALPFINEKDSQGNLKNDIIKQAELNGLNKMPLLVLGVGTATHSFTGVDVSIGDYIHLSKDFYNQENTFMTWCNKDNKLETFIIAHSSFFVCKANNSEIVKNQIINLKKEYDEKSIASYLNLIK